MSLCLDYDPDRRATCTELMSCSYFDGFEEQFAPELDKALRLDGNRLSGVVPPLPFAEYRTCDMSGNAFDCPLPGGADMCKDGAPTCGNNNAAAGVET